MDTRTIILILFFNAVYAIIGVYKMKWFTAFLISTFLTPFGLMIVLMFYRKDLDCQTGGGRGWM